MILLEKDTDSSFCGKLKALMSTLETWDRELKSFQLLKAIEKFMDTLWELYLAYFRYHIEEARICSLDYQELLISKIPLINKKYVAEKWYSILSADRTYDSPWLKACRLRSNIEAFDELFGFFTGKLEDEELLEFMEERKESINQGEGVRIINEGMPDSHWWWFVIFPY